MRYTYLGKGSDAFNLRDTEDIAREAKRSEENPLLTSYVSESFNDCPHNLYEITYKKTL